jgi:hypothetical protein
MEVMVLREPNMPIITPMQKDRGAKKLRAIAMGILEGALDQDSKDKGTRCRISTTRGTKRRTTV